MRVRRTLKYVTAAIAAAIFRLSLAAHARAADEKILPSTLSVNAGKHTAVPPLYRGSAHGETVWLVVTDASNAATARRLHVIHSPSLAAIGAAATRSARRVAKPGGIAEAGGVFRQLPGDRVRRFDRRGVLKLRENSLRRRVRIDRKIGVRGDRGIEAMRQTLAVGTYIALLA